MTGDYAGCLNCGIPDLLSMDSVIAVGFGEACVNKDNECVYAEGSVGIPGWPDREWRAADAERAAAADPDHKWTIEFHGPLSDRVYERRGPEQWELVSSGRGFA